MFLLNINKLLDDDGHVCNILELQLPVLDWAENRALEMTIEYLGE